MARARPAQSTGWPRPGTPIIEAMTTIDSAIMIVWLMPPMIVGSANGSWTWKSFWKPLVPKASAASSKSLSTSRMPRLVKRMTGGIA